MMELLVETCPNCEAENEIMWDIKTEGYEAFCPHCGSPMMLCNECVGFCDWEFDGTERGHCHRMKGT